MRCRLGSPQAVACAPCKSCAGPFSPPGCCGKAASCLSPQPAQRGQSSRQAVRKWWCCPAGLGPVLSLQVPARRQHPHPVLLDLWRRRPSRATTTASCTVLPAIAVSTSAGNAAGISVPMQRTAAQTPVPLCASREEPAAEPSLVARLLLLAARALCAEGLARLEGDFLHPLPV